MPEYAPTPNLDNANPIQRYLHKGALEPRDWIALALIVICYVTLRPSIERLMQRYFDANPAKTSQDLWRAAKASKAKVSPNEIRGVQRQTKDEGEPSQTSVTASGKDVYSPDKIVLKRGKSEFTAKTLEQQLLDWDDVEARQPKEGDKGDVLEWIDKWDE